jgi:hypothetical protein
MLVEPGECGVGCPHNPSAVGSNPTRPTVIMTLTCGNVLVRWLSRSNWEIAGQGALRSLQFAVGCDGIVTSLYCRLRRVTGGGGVVAGG